MTSEDLENMLTEKEVAQLLRMSVPGVRNLRLRGQLDHFRFGLRVLYSRRHVEDFLKRNERKSSEEVADAA
jgi:hypothetical protein